MEALDPCDHPLDLPAEEEEEPRLVAMTNFTQSGKRSRGSAGKTFSSRNNPDWRQTSSFAKRKSSDMTLDVVPEMSLAYAAGINVSVEDSFEDEIDLENGPTQADYLVAATLKHSKLTSLREQDVEVPTQVTIMPPMVLLKSFRKKAPWYRQPKYQLGLVAILLVVIGVAVGLSVGGNKSTTTTQAATPPSDGYASETNMLEAVLDFDDEHPAPTERPVLVRKAI